MYLIPLVRTSRCITSCFLYPYNPLLAISISEISSFIIPILYVNNHNINNKVNTNISNYLYNFYYNLFGFIFILNFDTNYANDLIEFYKNKDLVKYYIELILLIIFILDEIKIFA